MCGLYIELDLFNNLTEVFRIKLSNTVTKREVDRVRSITKRYTVCEFFPDLRRPNSIQYLELDGYWQTYKNFIEYADEIKKQFVFTTKIIRTAVKFFAFHLKKRSFSHEVRYLYTALENTSKDDIQTVLKAVITASDATWVGIHIRRTDIMMQKVEASPAYIYAAMDFLRTRYSRTLFVIGSDDKRYCVENFGNLPDVILTSPSFSPAEDLAILSICQHTIVTAGTFGWWAAFLAGGETLHDNKYLSNLTGVDNLCAKKDYYLPSFLVPIQHSSNHLNESVSPENQTYIFKRFSVLMSTKF
jgi:galactoside 2-L-fucosyltransferase 1/2